MKITNYNAQMSAQTSKTVIEKTKASSLSVVATKKLLRNGSLSPSAFTDPITGATIKLSDEAKKALEEQIKQANEEQERQADEDPFKKAAENQIAKANKITTNFKKFMKADFRDYRISILERMMQALTGKKIKLQQTPEIKLSYDTPQTPIPMTNEVGAVSAFVNITSFTTERYESESVSFSAQANVSTEDGREINVDLGLNLSRELYQKLEINQIQAGVFVDPLVINFDADIARLNNQKITFDLDCDGKSDQISTLAKGSGYLALDKNGDGVINDGSELFGAQNGDGFADLAGYDKDGNGWIDENDEIWDKLRIWVHDENGEPQLLGLGEVGVGAIFLGNVNTDYTLSGDNPADVNGMLRKTGFFLKENGGAGTVQHVDLKI